MPGIIVCAVLLVQFSFSQGRLSGQVAEVIDGRTLAIDVSGTRLTLVLQLIEVPEPGQPLNKEVAEHLRGLLVGKVVEFKVRSMADDKAFGAVFLKGVDVSQQMLRDGGAWLIPPELAEADIPERESYQVSEAQARADKIGVWAVKDLKPAWEFRAEKPKQNPPNDTFRYSALSDPSPGRPRTLRTVSSSDPTIEMWADVMNGPSAAEPGLVKHNDSDGGVRLFATTPTLLVLASGKDRQKLVIRALYMRRDGAAATKDELYVIGLQAASKGLRLARTTNASIDAEGETISLGAGKPLVRQNNYGSQEMLFYLVSRKALTAIASARKSIVTIGSFTGPLDVESQSLMLQLLDASN